MRISDWSSDVCSSDLQIYSKAKPDYTGRVTVPVLWDRLRGTIVSNESANIIRMFNSAFDGLTGSTLDFYPRHLRQGIDTINDTIHDRVNTGVYQYGFAPPPKPYDEGFHPLVATPDPPTHEDQP